MKRRVTVGLPADLLNRAKRKAAAEGRTLTSLIEDGLRPVLVGSKRAGKGAAGHASDDLDTIERVKRGR